MYCSGGGLQPQPVAPNGEGNGQDANRPERVGGRFSRCCDALYDGRTAALRTVRANYSCLGGFADHFVDLPGTPYRWSPMCLFQRGRLTARRGHHILYRVKCLNHLKLNVRCLVRYRPPQFGSRRTLTCCIPPLPWHACCITFGRRLSSTL